MVLVECPSGAWGRISLNAISRLSPDRLLLSRLASLEFWFFDCVIQMPEAAPSLRRHRLSPQEVADHILKLLPEDGTPVLNRVMRTMLAREFRQPIEPELYFSARNLLLNNDQIGRLRGQGGQLFALSSGEASEPAANERERWAERELMQPLEKYLNGTFRKGLDLPEDGHWIVHDTSSRGPLRGQWARPDYILVTEQGFPAYLGGLFAAGLN